MVVIDEDAYLAHYGILRRSGRYPWGSGKSQSTRNRAFIDYVEDMERQGLTLKDISKGLDIPIAQLRSAKSRAKAQIKEAQTAQAQRLKDKGWSNSAIGRRLGKNESYVRTLLAPGAADKAEILRSISNMLKAEVDEKRYVDVGLGVEKYLGISQEKLKDAIAILEDQGYNVRPVPIPQVGTGHDTRTRVLVPPGVTQNEVWRNQSKIQQISRVSKDSGRTFDKFHEPISIDPKRVQVRYARDGGDKADGIIYVREGKADISLGENRYAQVRIKIGDSHYLKGMAIYRDDLPKGVDLVFNTPKDDTGNIFDAMKPLKDDPLLPFGSVVRQLKEHEGTDKERVISAMHIVNEEGRWGKWNRNISAQALSKQDPRLAQAQLAMTYEARKAEYDSIMKLTNPVIKKKLLESFADATDSSAVHLKAAALERQNWRVILPFDDMPPTQIYAPDYNNGERVVLIRYPHGGRFEIPELIVNNNHKGAKKLLGDNPKDAVGIHHSVAEWLSGADFDGDTVLVIPNNTGRIKAESPLAGLKGFDAKRLYSNKREEDRPSNGYMQNQMGQVSNLITDMTLKGAPHSDLVRAVRHSMVVIDSNKHNLNIKQSAIDNNIKDLKKTYQQRVDDEGVTRSGASTIISRAGAETRIPERRPRRQSEGGHIDPTTGELVYVPTGARRKDGTPKLVKMKQLAVTNDPHSLSSGLRVEKIYADHSARLKSLANQARLSYLNAGKIKTNPSAKKTYADQVASLQFKLDEAFKNKPLERQAQIIAAANVKARLDANPDLSNSTIKKLRYQEQEKARLRMGAQKAKIDLDDLEWEAIQAGAISNNMLEDIVKNANMDRLRELATPRSSQLMTQASINRAVQMLEQGYTRAQVASQLGVSVATLDAATTGDAEDDD